VDMRVVCYAAVQEEGNHELGMATVPAGGEFLGCERGVAF